MTAMARRDIGAIGQNAFHNWFEPRDIESRYARCAPVLFITSAWQRLDWGTSSLFICKKRETLASITTPYHSSASAAPARAERMRAEEVLRGRGLRGVVSPLKKLSGIRRFWLPPASPRGASM